MNKMMTTQVMRGLSVLAVAAALAACGGGGGGEDIGGGGGGGSVVTPPAPADLQAEKASGYVANSANAYMFNQLNAARMKCGFGALHHDTRLDVSAQNHADWIARNNYDSTHNEVSGTLGFTGVNSRQRMESVNYKAFAEPEFPGSNVSNFLASEGISSTNFEISDYYKAHIPLQLSVVYHANGALSGFRNIGFGAAKRSTYGFAAGEIILHNLGSQTASQKLAGDVVATYPCDGVTALRTFHANERPNPLGTRDLVKNPPGHPVMILSRWGTKLTDIKVVMNEVSTGAEVKMAAVRTMDNDTSGLMLRNEAFAIPDAELKKSTSYSVKITGKVDGKDFENNFTFTTGTVDSIAVAGRRYE